MSASQSDLTSKQYGYDMVVGVTQASVNATMEQWLSQVEAKPFVIGYKFNPAAPDPRNPYYPIDDWAGFVADLGFDPFALPDGTKPDDARMARLLKEYFAFAFQAEIGLPDVPLTAIPPVISFDKQGSYVTYNMVNKVFQVVGVQTPTYGDRYWLNASQADGTEVWDFRFTVDLDLRQDNLNNHFHKLPPATQSLIKNLGPEMFSVRQLFLDLNTAALSDSYQIKGLDPASATYQMLCNVFFQEYFKNLAADGGVLLGFGVTADREVPDTASLIPTDVTFEVSPYLEDGKPTGEHSACTLNYLIMSGGRAMPAPVPFTWNWVDKDDLRSAAGVMAVNRNVFRDFLADRLAPELAHLAARVDCTCNVNLIEFTVGSDFSPDTAAHQFRTTGSGGKLLTYAYASSDTSSDTFVPNWGRWNIDYSSTCDVSVRGTVITVAAAVNAHCYLNVDGGVTEGDWASYEITTTYTVGVSADGGNLIVTENTPQVVDKSEKPDPGWWSKLITLGTIAKVVNEIQGYLQPVLQRFGTGLADDIARVLNGSQGWIFPGGETFAFTHAEFSDYQDLVAELLYATPKGR